MLKIKLNTVLAILFTILGLLYSLPNFTTKHYPFLPSSKLNLGLDLKGGAHLLLLVDFESYMKDSMETLVDDVRKVLRQEKIGYLQLKTYNQKITIMLRDSSNYSKLIKLIQKLDPRLEVKLHEDNLYTISYSNNELSKILSQVIDQSIEIVRMRVDSRGTTEAQINRHSDKYILLQVPGESDPQKLKNILGQTAKMTFNLVRDNISSNDVSHSNLPKGTILLESPYGNVVVEKKSLLTGDMLTNAYVTFDKDSRPIVAFSFNTSGSKIFAKATSENTGKRIAIILDNKLLSAPVINEPILGGSGTISGNFTTESASELALMLKAGALPAPLKIVEERSVGASLGADSIDSGIKATIIAFIAITVFMAWSYGILGIFANIALSISLLYILALLSLLQATLTLPGIAGIVLTMGMAVDANVLIYERIKEELRKGLSNLYAVNVGFKSAFITVADSNITTLIVAILLYIFGTGAIRGFAVTLSIGIISSMFSAIVITRLLIDMWIRVIKPKNLGLGVVINS